MYAIRATVKSGRLKLDALPEWPDGTEVLIGICTPVLGEFWSVIEGSA
jgi:hypothetical protein